MGAVVASLLSAVILYSTGGLSVDLFQHPDLVRTIQLLSSLFTFLFPAFGMGWLCSTNLREYLYLARFPHIRIILIAIASMLLLTPFVSLTEILNKLIVFPDWMAPIESWMQNQEDAAQKMTSFLLADPTPYTFIFNLLVIAVGAAVTEEFLFRGALQRVLGGFTANHHLVIWIAAILFSAFHLQFYGFIPRMILGAYFGYMLYWSRNIWLPVLVHFFNNTVAMIGMSDERLKDNEFFTGDLPEGMVIPFAVAAIIILLLFFFPLAMKLKKTFDDNPKTMQ